MLSNLDLIQLATHTAALFVNNQGVAFTLKVDKGGSRGKIRYHVRLRCKRYKDGSDCMDSDECCCGAFCKCNWEETFFYHGVPRQPLSEVLAKATKRADNVCYCKSCCALTPTTEGRQCFTCILTLLTRQQKECCICLENHRTSFDLDCKHTLCVLCARRLLLTNLSGDLTCPCCRSPLTRASLATCIPAIEFNNYSLPQTRG